MSKNLMEASRQWATRPADQRFQTLDALRDSVHNRRMRSRSGDVTVSNMKITAEGDGIFVNGQTAKAAPSNWAFGQLAAALGAPAGYMRQLPAPLAVECLRHGIGAAESGSKVKLMAVESEDGGDRTLQALTSPTYGRIWDADVADAAGRIVERSGGRFHNPLAYNVPGQLGGNLTPSGLYASDRDVFIFMIDGGSLVEAGPRAQINRGFFLQNSEVGAATFKLTTFLFNVVCGNHIVWNASNVNELVIRHTKNGPARFDGQAMPALLDYANASAAPLEAALRRAMAYNIAENLGLPAATSLSVDHVKTWAGTRSGVKFSNGEIKEAIAYAEREEGQCATLWDLTQGLTAYARGFDFLDARIDLETRAGKLLNLVKE